MSSSASDEKVSVAPEVTATKSRLQTFRALRYRDFRFLWISLIVSSVRTWMQSRSHIISPWRQASSFFLFALVGGSMADLVDKRHFLLMAP